MTQSFNAYVYQQKLRLIRCDRCNVVICYMKYDDEFIICGSCMDKDYEENIE